LSAIASKHHTLALPGAYKDSDELSLSSTDSVGLDLFEAFELVLEKSESQSWVSSPRLVFKLARGRPLALEPVRVKPLLSLPCFVFGLLQVRPFDVTESKCVMDDEPEPGFEELSFDFSSWVFLL